MSTPEQIIRHDELVEALQTLRSSSTLSFKALAAKVGRPTTTVHGWFSGRHLPYQRDNDDFQEALRALGVDDTDPWMDALARVRRTQADEPVNPYKGLLPYDEADADRFFGRAALVKRLVELVEAPEAPEAPEAVDGHPVVVLGPSGSGKSSLMRAGLLPTLRTRGWPVSFFSPGQAPSEELQRAIEEVVGQGAGDSDGDSDDAAPRGVIVVDQFEEVLGRTDTETSQFLDELEAAASRFTVVIGVRSDFFHQASANPWLLDGIKNRLLFVEPPRFDVIPELVNGPAALVGLQVESALLPRLVDEFRERGDAGGASSLPLLSHVLYALVESSPDGNLTLAGYEALGGIEAALENAAERAYESLDPRGREICEALFKQLVDLRDDSVPTRRVIDLADYEAAFGDEGLAEVVEAFTARRILTTGIDRC